MKRKFIISAAILVNFEIGERTNATRVYTSQYRDGPRWSIEATYVQLAHYCSKETIEGDRREVTVGDEARG